MDYNELLCKFKSIDNINDNDADSKYKDLYFEMRKFCEESNNKEQKEIILGKMSSIMLLMDDTMLLNKPEQK